MTTKLSVFIRIVLLLPLILVCPQTTSASTSETKVQSGESLTQEGFLLLDSGQPDRALKVWEKAHDIYKQSQNQVGVNGTLLNQSLALQNLGQYYRACTVLSALLKLNHQICQSDSNPLKQYQLDLLPSKDNSLEPGQQVIAYNNLGDVLRFLGQLKSSEVILEQALLNTDILDSGQRSTIELSLANTYQSQYKQAHNQLLISSDPRSQDENLQAAQTYASDALDLYQKLSNGHTESAIRAQLNVIELIQHLQGSDAPELDDLYHQQRSLIKPLIKSLHNTDFTKFAPTEAIHYQLKLSELLAELSSNSPENSLVLAFRHARAALTEANSLQDFRLRSQAYGTLGKIYLQSQQIDDAKNVFTKALKLAQAISEDDLSYQWSWQIAQIHEKQGEQTQAIAAYSTTLKHLNQVRTLLVSANSD